MVLARINCYRNNGALFKPTLEKVVKYRYPSCMSKCLGCSTWNVRNVFFSKILLTLRDIEVLTFAWNWGLWCYVNFFLFLQWHILRQTTYACYCLGYCCALVRRNYELGMGVSVIGNKVKQRQLTLFMCVTVNFEFEYFTSEEAEVVLTDTLMNFQDWHLTWL